MRVVITTETPRSLEAICIDSTGQQHTIRLVTGVPAFCSCRRAGCIHIEAVLEHINDTKATP